MEKKFDYDTLFSKDPFKDMEPQKLERLKKLHQKIQNKKGVDAFLILKELNETLSNGKPLTASERDKMISAMKEMLSINEAKKFDAMANLMKMM